MPAPLAAVVPVTGDAAAYRDTRHRYRYIHRRGMAYRGDRDTVSRT